MKHVTAEIFVVLNSGFLMLLYESSHKTHPWPVATGLVRSLPAEMAVKGTVTRPTSRAKLFVKCMGIPGQAKLKHQCGQMSTLRAAMTIDLL